MRGVRVDDPSRRPLDGGGTARNHPDAALPALLLLCGAPRRVLRLLLPLLWAGLLLRIPLRSPETLPGPLGAGLLPLLVLLLKH